MRFCRGSGALQLAAHHRTSLLGQISTVKTGVGRRPEDTVKQMPHLYDPPSPPYPKYGWSPGEWAAPKSSFPLPSPPRPGPKSYTVPRPSVCRFHVPRMLLSGGGLTSSSFLHSNLLAAHGGTGPDTLFAVPLPKISPTSSTTDPLPPCPSYALSKLRERCRINFGKCFLSVPSCNGGKYSFGLFLRQKASGLMDVLPPSWHHTACFEPHSFLTATSNILRLCLKEVSTRLQWTK